MNHFNTRLFLIVCFLATIVLVGSCEQSGTPARNAPTAANTGSNATLPVNAQPQAPATAGSNLPVTMPLLDAMFADESFGSEVKQQVQLSDEELAKVQDAARNTVLQLGADVADDDARSTRTAVKNTQIKIEAIIGP